MGGKKGKGKGRKEEKRENEDTGGKKKKMRAKYAPFSSKFYLHFMKHKL